MWSNLQPKRQIPNSNTCRKRNFEDFERKKYNSDPAGKTKQEGDFIVFQAKLKGKI